MGFFLKFGYGNNSQPVGVETDLNGNLFYTVWSSDTALGKEIPDRDKIKVVTRNPALLKVVALDCDIFSLGKVNKYDEGKLIEKDFLYSEKKKPNFKQSWTQLFWDYKFYLDIYGVAHLYNPNNSKVLNDNSSLQWLDPSRIEWNPSLLDKLKAFVFSNKTWNEINKSTVNYRLDNGSVKPIRLDEIATFYDLTNIGDCNPMKGISRIDSLYKVIKNSELALDAKGINLEMSGKFMVSGQSDPENVSQLPMSNTEKNDIETKVRSNKKVHAVKSKIDINRFVENIGNLKLDESFFNDYFMFGSMFNIPRDILETNLRGSTYENQEKAMARLIEYCQSPKGQMLTDWLENQFSYEDVKMSWDHLMFNQVFEKERAEKVSIQIDNIIKSKGAGAISESESKKLIQNLINT